jgi:chaperonin GroES
MADWSDRVKSTLLENRQVRTRPLTSNKSVAALLRNEMNRRRWKQPPIASIEHSAPRASIKMAKRLIPLLDRVLVEKIVAPTKSVGGILLPESAVSKVRARENALRSRRRVVVTPRGAFVPPHTDDSPLILTTDQRGEGGRGRAWQAQGSERRPHSHGCAHARSARQSRVVFRTLPSSNFVMPNRT